MAQPANDDEYQAILSYLVSSAQKEIDLVNYAKAYFLEVSSLDKYLGRMIYHKRLRTFFELRTLKKILRSRIGIISATVNNMASAINDPDKAGPSAIGSAIANIGTAEFSRFLDKAEYKSKDEVLEIFETVKVFSGNNFRKTNQEFSNVLFFVLQLLDDRIEKVMNQYHKDNDDIVSSETLQKLHPVQINDLELLKTLVLFKQKCNDVRNLLQQIKNISSNVQLSHFMNLPGSAPKRKYLLHIVGGLGTIAGIKALHRFMNVIKDAGYNIRIRDDMFPKERRENASPDEAIHYFNEVYNAKTIKGGEYINTLSQFEINIDGEYKGVIFTNDEDSIASRQAYFNIPDFFRSFAHFTTKDYVYDLAKIINRYDSSLVYIICNTASAPDELRRLSHITHSFFYDLPGGFVTYLSGRFGGRMACFLSTEQLYRIGTYQKLAKNHMHVYESEQEFGIKEFRFIDREDHEDKIELNFKIKKDMFYHRLTAEVINQVKARSGSNIRDYVLNFLELLGYIDFEGEVVIGLCCTELPIAYADLLYMQGGLKQDLEESFFMLVREYRTNKSNDAKARLATSAARYKAMLALTGRSGQRFIFEDPLDIGNLNVISLLKKNSVIEEKHSILGPQDYRSSTRNNLYDTAVNNIPSRILK